MKRQQTWQANAWLKASAAVFVAAALTGVGFAMWLENGAGIFIAMAQSGLAWCF
ncbi:hypothetical protein [Nitratireductor pacificus]|uniref:hypothetical protein n=1 Tax=Nitratireductor pacificus TaxID=1231180 RepID=UPI0003156E0E|nr:hypothetical protein [Nitratireductor pacificus]